MEKIKALYQQGLVYLNKIKEDWFKLKAAVIKHKDVIINCSGYIPYFGWLIPYFFIIDKDDAFRIDHVKTQMTVAQIYFVFSFAFYCLFLFSPQNWYWFRLILSIIINLLQISYLVFAIFGIKTVYDKKKFSFKIIDQLADREKLV